MVAVVVTVGVTVVIVLMMVPVSDKCGTDLPEKLILARVSFYCCSCSLFVCWLLNVPATCECISGTDLLRQFYVLPHGDGSRRPNFPSHPVTVH